MPDEYKLEEIRKATNCKYNKSALGFGVEVFMSQTSFMIWLMSTVCSEMTMNRQ